MAVSGGSKSGLAKPGRGGYLAAMSITAVVEKGLIRLPKEVSWASGTLVRIEPVPGQSPTLLDAMKDFDGMVEDAPADLAANLDHYVHGHSRK